MSGHSKWATIKRSKGKADAARGKLFSRLIREITIAARMGGGDPEGNPRLRSAILSARANNMPNKNIDSAVAKGTGQVEGVTYEEVAFEAFAPGGVAIVIECMTDNRNRTVAEVRHALTRYGANMAAVNSVRRLFHSKGVLMVPKGAMEEDKLLDLVLEAGAEDMSDQGEVFEILTEPDAFESVRTALQNAFIVPESAELSKVPETTVKVEGDSAGKILRLISMLDDLDDTQHVYSNFEISDEDMNKFEADQK